MAGQQQPDPRFDTRVAAALWNRAQHLRSLPTGYAHPDLEHALLVALRYSSAPVARGLLHLELGEVYQKNRRFARAREQYDRAAHTLEQAGDPWLSARAWTAQGTVRFAVGKWGEGETLCRQALATQRSLKPEGSLEEAETLNCLGLILGQKPELEEAQALLTTAIDIQSDLAPNSNELAHSLIQLAVVFRMQRAFKTADRLLERATNLLQANDAPLPELAFVLKHRGKNAHWAGELDTALEYLEQSYVAYEAAGIQEAQLAASLERLGLLALEQGDLEAGLRHAQEALRLRSYQAELDDSPESTTNSRALLADCYEQLGLLHHALAQYTVVLALRQQVALDDFWVAFTHDAVSRIYSKLDHLQAARHHSDQAIELFRRSHSDSFWLVDALTQRGLIEAGANNPVDGLAWFDQAADSLEAQTAQLGGSRQTQAGFRSQFHDIYHHLVELALEQGDTEAAFHALERSRAQNFLAMLSEHASLTGDQLPPALQARKAELQQRRDRIQYDLLDARRRADQEAITQFQDAALDSQIEYDLFQRLVQERRRQRLLDAQAPVLDLEAVRGALDQGTLLVSYSVQDDRILAFSLTRDAPLEVHTVELGAAEVRTRVDNFRWWVLEARPGMPRQDLALSSLRVEARSLYKQLLNPFQSRIEQAERLLILPDSELHVLPWAALQTPNGRFLMEEKAVHIAPSAAAYLQLQNRQVEQEPAVLLAAFGGPQYPERLRDPEAVALGDAQLRSVVERGFALQPLPFSEQEVRGISRLFGSRSRSYLGDRATEERAKGITHAKYLHFATHAIVDPRMPLHSALALSIPDQLQAGQENGLLEVWEILESVHLAGTELVVLSSCESALGQELNGEGIIGLTRAFQIAGAKSVMASLWNVQDDSTAELMRRFYLHLDHGLPKAEALRQAQIEMLRGQAGEASSLPFAWAAFQVYGDWE